MTQRPVHIRVDDRVRLMSAVLAATKWPEREQQMQRHRAHAHARNTTKRIERHKHHPAIEATQVLLDKGAPLEALYTYALKLTWPEMEDPYAPRWVPPKWNEQLKNFYQVAELEAWWKEEDEAWQKARSEAEKLISKVNFYTFLQPFVGEVVEQLVFVANVSYPSTRSVGVRIGGELMSITPPRIAWGDNAPWPFDEDAGHLYTHALGDYARLLMLSYLRQNADRVAAAAQKPLPVTDEFKEKYVTWGDQFTELFVIGAVALFLEQAVNPQEAKAFILMQDKAKGVKIIPGLVSVLRRYLNEFADGKYESLINYLPNFPGHLRVAKSISSL